MIISKHKNNLTTEYIVPERIIISENCERPHLLLEDTPCQATFGNSDVFVLKAGGFVVLDFGEELHGGAVDAAKTFWGAMLDLGATTFWESFDLEKSKNAVPIDQIVPEGRIDAHADFGDHCYKGLRHSLCHGWASGPAPFAGRYILGVNPIEPGFKKVSVKPDIANFKYIHGTFPTPHGDIEVTAERKGGKVISDIKVPDGVELFDSQV